MKQLDEGGEAMRRLLVLITVLTLAMWTIPAMAADCVDVDLGANVISSDPYDILSLYFMVVNCGTEPGLVSFDVTLTKDFVEVGTAEFACNMPAGEPFEQEIQLPIPTSVPAGTYTLCVTATLGDASDTACASITLDEMNNVTSFSDVTGPVATDPSSWGAIKGMYK